MLIVLEIVNFQGDGYINIRKSKSLSYINNSKLCELYYKYKL